MLLLTVLYFSIDLLDFKGVSDSMYLDAYGLGYLDALRLDRIDLFETDLIRTFIYVILSFLLLSIYKVK